MKKLNISRLVCLLLVALMLLPIAACGNPQDDDTSKPDETTPAADVGATTTPADSEVVTEAPSNTDEKGYLKDDLDPTLNFNDKEFTLLYWSDREHEEFYVETQTGDLVDDAIYDRNIAVEDRLGIRFNYMTEKGNASNVDVFTNKVNNSISAGDHAYDLVAAHSYTIGKCATQNLLFNLAEVEHIDFDKPWWPDKLISQATINDKLFFVSGDISANVIYMMYVTFFNKKMLENYNLEDPYKLVEDGKWTIDKQFAMCENVYTDLNSNGTKDIGDQYGQYTYTLHLDSFLWGSDIVILDTTDEIPEFSEDFLGEKTLNLQEKVRTFFNNTNDGYLLTVNSTVHQYFGQGISLFWNDRCRQAITFSSQEISYGIIPIPKYDEAQENFATLLGNPFSLYGVPKDSLDTEMAGAVIECMASESYRTISPALYEVALKAKYSQDDIASKMFDIAKSSVVFDLGRILSSSLGGPASTWQNAISGGGAWTTMVRSMSKPWKTRLNALLKVFE